MFEISGSNLGLCKYAYFIKKCASIVDGLVVVAGLDRIFSSSFLF